MTETSAAKNKVRLQNRSTVMCLTIGTPNNNKFSICSKWKTIFMCPKIWVHYSLIILCSNIGTPKDHHFPFGTFGKVSVLGVPVLKYLLGYISSKNEVKYFKVCHRLVTVSVSWAATSVPLHRNFVTCLTKAGIPFKNTVSYSSIFGTFSVIACT